MIAANVLSKEEFPDFDEETGILPKVDDEEGNQPLGWTRMMDWEDSWQVQPWIGFICSLNKPVVKLICFLGLTALLSMNKGPSMIEAKKPYFSDKCLYLKN